MNIYWSQIKKIMRRKQFWVIFILFLGIVFLDFYLTCRNYQGKMLSEIPSAYNLIIIDNYFDGSIGDLFFRNFPFFLFVSIIGSDIFYEERHKGIYNFTFTRMNRYRYMMIQAAALISVVFFVVVLSILLSLGLALTAFPMQGYMLEDVTGYNSLLATPGYILSTLRVESPYTNAVLYAFIWGIAGAVFALLGYSLSFIHQLKKYTILLVPMTVYLIYTVISSQMVSQIKNVKISTAIGTYLLQVNGPGNILVYMGILFVVFFISILLILRGLSNDQELL